MAGIMKHREFKGAFTLLELVFVIVVIGILATVAVPRLWVSRDDAIITKGRSDVATIRSAISTYKQKQLLEGNATLYPASLDEAAANTEDEELFKEILDYPVYSGEGEGEWMKTGSSTGTDSNTYTYTYKIQNDTVTFTYDSATGKFDCDHTKKLCKDLTH